MIIGIALHEVLRDFSGNFREVYEKFTDNKIEDDEVSLTNLFKYFSGDTDATIDFLYEEHPLEIFGYANELFNNSGLTLKAMMEQNPDDEFMMSLMVRAGFKEVFIGIETPDEEGLLKCNKKQNIKRNLLESVKRIQHAGLQVQGGFIVGFDTDEPSIFQRQIDFIQKSGIVTAMVGLLQAPPGTKLYARLKKEGRVRPRRKKA